MKQIKLKAMAKINLGLDVTGKREDGYHEVRMIMQSVRLFDRITMKILPKPEITVSTNLHYLPVNENNLVYKAAKLLMDEFPSGKGVHIDLEKHIPVAAGLAGGSSDAACVLFGMNKLFKLNLTEEDLMIRGKKIGADVPFCIMRGTALAEGIGEVLTPLPGLPKCHILIAKPGISVSTKFVYQNLRVNELQKHPDIDALIQGLTEKNLKSVARNMENVLETVTIKQYPIIEEIKNFMKENGAVNAMMSGSGPTVFGIFENESTAKKAFYHLRKSPLAKQVYLTEAYQNKRR